MPAILCVLARGQLSDIDCGTPIKQADEHAASIPNTKYLINTCNRINMLQVLSSTRRSVTLPLTGTAVFDRLKFEKL
ncbi:unnamed protein product [Nippostrongylus brasiliensis]|uniref:Secreted protein n=1 Tax=Nippostrongylus brasiliensis TaxID=27835 RepID=A0A0N4YMZ7_NIPBR|nr:unnamed protein product [Nippostrongylus brasiliensis]